MKKVFGAMILLTLGGLMVVGVWLACSLVFPLLVVRDATSGLPCTPPPKGFSEADLVGTWQAGTPDQSDTLFIRGDGTYKQVIHIDFTSLPSVDYESGWQPWWLEGRESGIPYLHLEGMRLCGFNPALSCDQAGGGGHDFCRNARVRMDNEGILLVLGVREPLIRLFGGTEAPRGISLVLPAGSENSWDYALEQP